MSNLQHLVDILQASFHKHGDKPVTLGHLLNIVKVAEQRRINEIENHDKRFDEIMKDIDPICQESL